jgi:hypothetical protein
MEQETQHHGIPGVVSTFVPNPSQVEWLSHPQAPTSTTSVALSARRRTGRTTWLATQVLRAVAEAAPKAIAVNVYVPGRISLRRFAAMILGYADPDLPATVVMNVSGGDDGTFIRMGPHGSVVNVYRTSQNTLRGWGADLIAADDVDYSGSQFMFGVLLPSMVIPTRFLGTMESKTPWEFVSLRDAIHSMYVTRQPDIESEFSKALPG